MPLVRLYASWTDSSWILRGSPFLHDQESWDNLVLRGQRSSLGMPGFAAVLSEPDSEAIRAYVIAQAWRGAKVRQASAD